MRSCPTTTEPADAELVALAAQGDLAAFDQLVLRYRDSVLRTARGIIGHRDEAEDAAQQAFIHAYAGLRGLQEPSKFKSWLMMIAKRSSLRRRSSFLSRPDTFGDFESVICSLSMPQAPPAGLDVAERVRESIQELSARSRQVITLHYLDGYSCREIGTRLGLTEGTVKRILHESRNSLRAGVGLEARGGTPTMESGARQTGPRHMDWWINGWWPGSLFERILPQSICLAVNKKPMTVRQIAKQVGADVEYVQEAMEPLTREGLVIEAVKGRYLTNFIALDAQDWIELTEGVREYGALLAEALIPHLPALESAWQRSPQPAQGFPWEKGIWPMLAILVCNLGISRKWVGDPEPEAPVHGSGKRYWAGGREEVAPEHVVWTAAFSNNSRPGDFGYGHFWSGGVPEHRSLDWPEDRRKALKAIAERAPSTPSPLAGEGRGEGAAAEQIAAVIGETVEHTREVVARAIELGLVERRGDALRLAFPVIGEEDDRVLCPAVDEVAARLCRDVVAEATRDVNDRLRKTGYGHLEEQFPSWQRWLAGNVAGEGLRELLSRGILPDPGPGPTNFCIIGWLGTPRLMSWNA